MNAPTRHATVETRMDRQLVRSWDGERASYEETVYMPEKDRFKKLIGDGNARINISLSGKLSGPDGTYSSVSINASVTLACNQDDATIQKAKQMAFAEVAGFLDETMGHSMALLHSMITEHYEP